MRQTVRRLLPLCLGLGAGLDNDKCSAPSDLGCFTDPYRAPDGNSLRVLNRSVGASDTQTRESCVRLCCQAGFGAGDLAGVENGTRCFCGHDMGPYPIPAKTAGPCDVACGGDHSQTCGCADGIQILGISSCPSSLEVMPADLQKCGADGCTMCPPEDTCCVGKSPDPYRVPGGYGCAPPNSSGTPGCAGGGVFPGGCCCAPGPALVSTTKPNVLIVGDSISAGYLADVRRGLLPYANTQHGPDNSGGGNADGVGYGALCMPYFLRTPRHELPRWDVVAFNFGLHDGTDSNASYAAGLEIVTETVIRDTAPSAKLVYFLTTIPGGSHSVPGEPVSPGDRRVLELNELAATVMAKHGVTVVDLYAAMEKCGETCKDCKPHCSAAGYQWLADNAIVPAIKKALGVKDQVGKDQLII